MQRAIRTYWKWMLAILTLAAIASVCAGYILINQRLRVPFQERYAVNAEFAASAGLVPGLGQPVNVAGVKVGQVSDVTLREGRSIVEMAIDPDELSAVYSDASAMLVPRTPLKDLQIQLDPGRKRSQPLDDGALIPVARTEVPVDSDELTKALDLDTRRFFQVLVTETDRGVAERGVDLRAILKTLEPTAQDLRRVTQALKGRRGELRDLVHELSVVARAAGSRDEQLAELVDAGATTLGALAAEERALGGTVRELPATLRAAQDTLGKLADFSDRVGPALEKLRPATRRLPAALDALGPLASEGATALRTRLRPFVRAATPVIRDVRPAVRDLNTVTPDLTTAFNVLNYVANELVFNPEGDNEGFLYWLAWFAHNGASFTGQQDANGPTWHGLVLASCETLTAQPGLEQLAQTILGALPICTR